MTSAIETFAQLLREYGPDRFSKAIRDTHPEFKEHRHRMTETAARFGALWQRSGATTFVLDHSLAAMLAVTKSPNLDWEFLPMPFVVVDIPYEYAPIYEDDKQNCKVGLSFELQLDGTARCTIGIFCDEWLGSWAQHDGGLNSEDAIVISNNPEQTRSCKHALRVAFNAIRYINEYKDRVETNKPRKDGTISGTRIVRAPRDVVVDRAFRFHARNLIRSESFEGARQALSHMVRGHWRNQPVGEERKERRLTWVRPHRRGDESLGRVVSRIERLK